MSSFEETRRIVTIVGICVGVLIGLSALVAMVRWVRREKIASDLQSRSRRIFIEQEMQRRRDFVIDGGDLEYGMDIRPEAQPSSFRGGMADVTHFGGNQATYRPARPEMAVPSSSGFNHASTLGPHSSPPHLGLSRAGQVITPVTAVVSTDRSCPVYNDPADMTRMIAEAPPAYSAVVPH